MKVWLENAEIPAAINSAIVQSVVSASLARSLHMAEGGRTVVHNGMMEEFEGHLLLKSPDLRLGDADLSSLDLVILSDDDVASLAGKKDRQLVIGADLFRDRIVQVTYPSADLQIVNEATACKNASYILNVGRSYVGATPGDVEHWNLAIAIPVIEIRVNGLKLTALIDLEMDDALVMNREFDIPNGKDGSDGMVDLIVGPVRTRVRVQRRDDAPAVFTSAFSVGRRAFGESTLTIDFKNGQICLR